TDLQERLDVRAEAIALESIEPSTFPCPSPSDCQERLPGYVIRLKADDVVYEYQGKVSERLSVIWHEVTEASVR
ncbi:MAG: hypothetical protein GX597_26505, partial [Anaerolineaceae bacterium]|nr:hypothetical protein [Anaerolineaceae bacterium]